MMISRVVAVVIALLAIGCSSPEEKVAEHLARGREHAAQGRLHEATVELRAALAIDPKRGDVHFELAEAYAALGYEGKALAELKKTVRLDPMHYTAKVRYALALALSRQAEDRAQALVLAREVVADRPTSLPARLAEARTLHALGRTAEARDAAAAAVEIDGGSAEARRLLALLYDRLDDPAAAEREYRAVIEVDGSFVSWLALAQHLAWRGLRDDEAEKAYAQAIELADLEDAMRGIDGYAGFLFVRGRVDEAGALLTERYARHGRPPELLSLLVRYYVRVGRDDEAEAIIRQAVAASADAPGPVVMLAAYLEDRGDYAGAEAAIAEVLRIDPKDPDAQLREAYLTVVRGKRTNRPKETARGRAKLAALIASEPPNLGRALVTRGRIELDEGDHVSAVESFGKGIALGADEIDAQAGYGDSLLRSDPRRAAAALRSALERHLASDELRILLVRALNRAKEYDQALEIGRPVLALWPDQGELRLYLVDSLAALGRLDEAVALLESAPEPTPELLMSLTRAHQRRGELGAARETIAQADRLERHSVRVLSLWLELDAIEDRVPESVARLQRADLVKPGNGEIAWLLARAAMMLGDLDKAQGELRRSIKLKPDHLPAYLDLAMLLSREGRIDDVVAMYEETVARQPNASVYFLLGLLHEQQQRVHAAIESYRKSVELDATVASAGNNLAYLLADENIELDYALELASAAKRDKPDDAGIADTLGWVHYRRGSFDFAVAYLREAVGGFPAGDPSLGLCRYHLALAEEARGDLDAARLSIEASLEDIERLQLPKYLRPPGWVREARALAMRLEEPDAG